MAGLDGLGGLGHGVQGGGQTRGVQEEGTLEMVKWPPGGKQADGWPKEEQGLEKARQGQVRGEGARGAGVLGDGGPTWRWVR